MYGAWALGLSGYSDVLDHFGTGDGQIALHGTANPDNLGTAVSHGCVRVDNAVITRLAASCRSAPRSTSASRRRRRRRASHGPRGGATNQELQQRGPATV